jgi:hypothetical protein
VSAKEKSNKLPAEFRKVLIDVGITFFDWCRAYNFSRETARNVASGIIQAKWGATSCNIKRKLELDFPECFDGGDVTESQDERYSRLKLMAA